MTYEETAKELSNLAKRFYESDNSLIIRNKMVIEIMKRAEELKNFIPDAHCFTLVKEFKRDSENNVTGFYFKSVIYRNKAYKKVYEIRFRLN